MVINFKVGFKKMRLMDMDNCIMLMGKFKKVIFQFFDNEFDFLTKITIIKKILRLNYYYFNLQLIAIK